MTTQVDVVGNALASLVAVDALAAAGQSVRWIRPPGPLSGGFQTLAKNGRQLELGMRLIELSYDDDFDNEDEDAATFDHQPPLADYRPGTHGHRPYVRIIERLIRELAGPDLYAVEAPSSWVEGTVGKDYVVVGDLSDLHRFVDRPTLRKIEQESAKSVEAEGPHGLFDAGQRARLDTVDFVSASRRHTGDSFWQALVEPLADSILGSTAIPAVHHRKIWMPLFHPTTVNEAASGKLTYIPDRPLYSVRRGGMGQIVARLTQRVMDSPHVTIVPVEALGRLSPNGESVTLDFVDGTSLTTTNPILGLDPRKLFRAIGCEYEPQRANTSIAWVETSTQDHHRDQVLSVEWVVDADLGVHRVTRNRGDIDAEGSMTFIVELRHDLHSSEVGPRAVRALQKLGLAGRYANIISAMQVPSFVLPTLGNAEQFAGAQASLLDLELSATLVGGVRTFAVDSLNEQIVQGLQAAEMASARTATTRST